METSKPAKYDNLFVLDQGCTSQCLTDGKTVVKLTRAGKSQEQAQKKYTQLSGEYEIFKKYLGEYAHDTRFSIESAASIWWIEAEQEFIKGAPLRKSLDLRNPALIDFFRRTLHLYYDTGFIPDLLPDIMFDPTGGVYVTGRFTYRSGPNVLMVQNQPLLVDTTLNKSLRGKIGGPILRTLVAARIRLLLFE